MEQLSNKLDTVIQLLRELVENTSMEIELMDPSRPEDNVVIDIPSVTTTEREGDRNEDEEELEIMYMNVNDLRLGEKWRILPENDTLHIQWFDGRTWSTRKSYFGDSE